MSPSIQLFCFVSLALLGSVGAVFYRRQNQAGRMGGRISRAKMLWLLYVLYVWFLLCPALSFEESLHPSLRVLLRTVSVLMWVRGVAELVMMYVFKNWRPPYGIAHDLLCVVVLGGGLWACREVWPLCSGADAWTLALLVLIEATFVLETLYAAAFYRVVGEGTQGEKAVWFAPEGDPLFRRVVAVTGACNIPLYAFLAAYLLLCIGTGP